MRYRYEEYSPQNKRQYVIACGVHELRAMLDACKAVSAHAPERTEEQRQFKTSLASSIKGLSQAIKQVEANKDTGKRRKPYEGNNNL